MIDWMPGKILTRRIVFCWPDRGWLDKFRPTEIDGMPA